MSFWKRRIYADAAAGTPLSSRSKSELVRLLDLYGNPGALHKEAVAAQREIENARKAIADALGAHADEIIFTGSGTEANNLAIEGVLRPLLRERGELQALTSAIEHSSVLEPLFVLEEQGLNTVVLPVSEKGLVDPKLLREAVNDETVLVSIQLVNSEIGTVQPIREIAKEIRRARASRSEGKTRPSGPERPSERGAGVLPLYLHVDASQAPLWLKVGVEQLGVDLLTLDAQKILGPKGVGALFVRRGTNIEPIIHGGSQESGLRAGTQNAPLIGAFAVALEDAQRGVEARAEKISAIRDYCFAEIKKLLPDAILNGAEGEERAANNINVSIPGLEAQMAVIALDAEGIAASTRSACDIGDEEPSHVIQALGVPKELAGTAIRITFLPDITKRDARAVAETLQLIAQRYRKVV